MLDPELALLKFRVLIVDDHRISRLGLNAILKTLPCVGEIEEATNGREAIGAVQRFTPDFVFMDIKMPLMDGIEATRLIAKQYPNVHVIALSVYDEARYLNEMFTSGAKGYLLKNTEPDEIMAALTAVAEGKLYYSKAVSDVLLQSVHPSNAAKGALHLSEREKWILYYLWQGFSSKEMARELFVSIQTVNMERGKLLAKTKSKNAVQLLKYALDAGIVEEMKRKSPAT